MVRILVEWAFAFTPSYTYRRFIDPCVTEIGPGLLNERDNNPGSPERTDDGHIEAHIWL